MPGQSTAAGHAVLHNLRTITIDRNARKALLAALSLRLESRLEGVHTTLRERDRMLLSQAQEFFDHLGPILDGLEFWDEGGTEPSPHAYTIPASRWLEELVEDYAQQIRGDYDQDEQWLSQIADKGDLAFEAGGEMYDREEKLHPRRQRLDWTAQRRRKLENDIDELVGCESIIAALSVTDQGEAPG